MDFIQKPITAFYRDEKGVEHIIQAPGAPLAKGHVAYDRHIHKGKLYKRLADDREYPVRLTFAQPSRGGSTLPALRAFFTPVARRRSPPVKKDNKASSLKIDKTKGYLIAINTSGFAETFGKTNGVYAISENRQVRVRDHDIKDRERIRVKNLRDIVEFLKRVDARRLQHTKVLFRNVLYNWDEFFIHYQKPERFDALIKKLDVIHPRDRRLQSGYLLRGGFHPCIMEIRVQMPKRDSPK